METNTLEQQKTDEKFMRRCLQLARCGQMAAAPNPMVGAVIVCDGHIIGEGYHRRCGGPHAEVNAVRSVRTPELLTRSTIYVSLEPCAHWGKTPPCADLIVEKKIPRCVVGCRDPFAKVDGLGIKKLRDAGVEVKVGVLEQECLALNRRFMTFHTYHRPFVTLKWAQSRDGYMEHAISTATTQALVHEQRAIHQAIMVGSRTALADRPSLTNRWWSGTNPLRVVLDSKGVVPSDSPLFNDEAETLVWHNYDLDALLDHLWKRNVQSLLVEGGSELLTHFLRAGLWDQIRTETSTQNLGGKVHAPEMPPCELVSEETVDGNIIRFYVPEKAQNS